MFDYGERGENMNSFKTQIDEDIKVYQEKYPAHHNMQKAEWAFNYWVLDKFFNEEEELIFDKIIDYKDRGIDAYEWYDDTKELYLLQNKYYTTTKLTAEYVENNFLVTPIAALEKGTYTNCEELQKIYTQNKGHENFTVYLQLYVTNDIVDAGVKKAIKNFNANEAHKYRYVAEVYYLSDIEEKWYGEPAKNKKELSVYIESVNGGTILNVNNEAYQLDNGIDAKYVFAPVSCIYEIVKKSKDKGYPLFEKNIREYLGNNKINKNICRTLETKSERKNFFYYNNGITMICDKIGSQKQITSDSKRTNPHSNTYFEIKNPQIVNGCQTVNSIFAVLDNFDKDDISTQFKDAFVMLKVLQIDSNDTEEKDLSKNIVTYNNSQNGIDEKSFVANSAEFQRIKTEFESKGFLLLAKQSDKNTFSKKYSKQSEITKLRERSIERRKIFGLEMLKSVSDFQISLEKLLQVILAFKENGVSAYTLKKDVLNPDKQAYKSVMEFIKSSNVTTDVLLDLYLLFLRSEKEKGKKGDDKVPSPISFYLIDGFACFECNNRDSKLIKEHLQSAEKINDLIHLYKVATKQYAKKYTKEHDVDYIKMIKMPVDYELLSETRDSYFDYMESM